MISGDDIDRILSLVQTGDLDLGTAREQLQRLAGGDLDFAHLDHDRRSRCGFPEVIYGAGKTPGQILAIMEEFRRLGRHVLVTRLSEDAAATILPAFPDAEHDPAARTLIWLAGPHEKLEGRVGVVTAGTSDRPVALEAANTLRFLGYSPDVVQDVGVAGLHRLLANHQRLRDYQVVIVVAGMEGALPSVVGGLVKAPVIAVPTSIGYGAHLDGLAPLLAMVNSCASGITVTNIDNGFGAACAAARILSLVRSTPSPAPTSQPSMAGCRQA